MPTPAVPGSPSPAPSGSPVGSAHDLSRPLPQIPDHELLHPIGRGAYGEVWLARNVVGTLRAVKLVYRHDFGDDHPFEREFQGIQKFEPISRSHPGLVNILQIGRHEAGGYFYYVMELADEAGQGSNGCRDSWIDGIPGQSHQSTNPPIHQSTNPPIHQSTNPPIHHPARYAPRTLRHDLRVRGRLPGAECGEIGLALTDALQHLHAHRLVHRDIKPSNIIFVKGQPKLADIGLVTEAGDSQSIVGTEGYLAPEGPGSAQADLFSLGKVLYEVSTGQDRRQFPDLPAGLKEWADAGALRQLNEVVLKACAKELARRYRSAEEMRADLARLQAGQSVRWRCTLSRAGHTMRRYGPVLAAAALLLLAVPWVMRQRWAQSPAIAPEKASVFVLPFRSEGTNGVPEDLRGRITDAFIDSLAVIEGVRRSPRKSRWVYQDETALRQSLARTNDMRHILTTRVVGVGDTLTLTVRLHEREKDPPVWTESFSGKTNEVVELERRALGRLTDILGLKVTDDEQRRMDQVLTNNLEALRWMQQADSVYQSKAGTHFGYTEVNALAQKALDRDPLYVDAEAWMVYQLRNLSQDLAANHVWPAVYRGMSSVLEKDDTQPWALDQLGGYALFYKRNWAGAYELFEREFRCRPEDERLWLRAFVCRLHGWFEEARLLQQKSEDPEPTASDQRYHMTASRWVERRYAEGAQLARRTLEIYPGHAEGYFWLVHCLVAKGDFEQGLEAIQKAQGVWKKQEMTALKGYAYARMGQPEKAREALRELMDVQRTGPYLQPYFVARVYAALGENKAALDWLEKADEDKSEYLLFADLGGLRTDPAWDGLQNESRYWQLCERLGLGKNQWPRPKPAGLR